MDIHKLLDRMRKSGQQTDFIRLAFGDGWGVNITPDKRGSNYGWQVVVLYDDIPHYNNTVALGDALYGQNDEDVVDICMQIKDLPCLETAERLTENDYTQ